MKFVSKKILAKIEKEQEKLDAMIAKRDEFTANYQAKLAEINSAINEQKKVIADLREQEKREKLGVVADLVSKNGVSVDDLLNAVLSGNFEDIQSKIVKTGKATGNGASIREASDGDNNVVVSHESSSDTDVDSGNDDNYASAM